MCAMNALIIDDSQKSASAIAAALEAQGISCVIVPARRCGLCPGTNEYLTYGDLTVDITEREVMRNGRRIDLTLREYLLLEHLMLNARHVVSVATILQEVWGYDRIPAAKIVENKIWHLRQKLCARGERNIIRTVRGFGYTLR